MALTTSILGSFRNVTEVAAAEVQASNEQKAKAHADYSADLVREQQAAELALLQKVADGYRPEDVQPRTGQAAANPQDFVQVGDSEQTPVRNTVEETAVPVETHTFADVAAGTVETAPAVEPGDEKTADKQAAGAKATADALSADEKDAAAKDAADKDAKKSKAKE